MEEENITYNSFKVGQLRLLCKQRNLSVEGKKEDLIQRLINEESEDSPPPTPIPLESISPDIAKELATIADEMRHLRKIWNKPQPPPPPPTSWK